MSIIAGSFGKLDGRCSVRVNNVEQCPASNPRGFNVHIVDPYGEDIKTSFKNFDDYHKDNLNLVA